MAGQEVTVHSKSFQALFNDAEYFLNEASRIDSLFEEMPKGDSRLQELLAKRRACARGCILSSVAALESFANLLLLELKKRELREINPVWLSTHPGNKPITGLKKLEDKIKFIPVLCNSFLKPPDRYFNESDDDFKALIELRRIRNRIAHGEIVDVKFLVGYRSNGIISIAYDGFPENFWPVTGIDKDIVSLDYIHAAKGYRIVLKIMNKLHKFLGKQITREFLLEQRFESKSGQKGTIQRQYANQPEPNWYLATIGKIKL